MIRELLDGQSEQEQLLWKRVTHEWLTPLAIVTITLLGIAARVSFRQFESGDYLNFLSHWYDAIKADGVASLSHQVGDYNLFFQFLILVMTGIPLPKLYAFKALSCFFDIVLAVASGLLGRKVVSDEGRDGTLAGLLCYAAAFLSPTVMLNSAAWAQCDSVYSAFCVLALLALAHRKNLSSLVLLGVAFCFKLQAIFIVPVFLYAAVVDRRYSIACLLVIPAVMMLGCVPFMPFGRSIFETFRIYAMQTGEYPYMWLKFPSVWAAAMPTLEMASKMHELGGSLFAIALTLSVMLVEVILLIKRKVTLDRANCVLIGLMLSLTAVLLLPSMHERYAYLVDLLAIIAAVIDARLLLPAAALNLTSLMTYCMFLFDTELVPDFRMLSVAYFIVCVCTLRVLYVHMCEEGALDTAKPEATVRKRRGAHLSSRTDCHTRIE